MGNCKECYKYTMLCLGSGDPRAHHDCSMNNAEAPAGAAPSGQAELAGCIAKELAYYKRLAASFESSIVTMFVGLGLGQDLARKKAVKIVECAEVLARTE